MTRSGGNVAWEAAPGREPTRRRAILCRVSEVPPAHDASETGGAPLRIHTHLLPPSHEGGNGERDPADDVVLLVDVLRTCTVVPILLERGLGSVRLSPSLRVARRAAAADGDLLIGERGGLPPEGFNHGNSPAALADRRFAASAAVVVSANAPSALPHVAGARTVLLASLVNLTAACEAAAGRARSRIDLVCCGSGGAPDLDDLATAGVLADGLLRLRPEAVASGATSLALSVVRTSSDPLVPLWQSSEGRYLRSLGLERDIGVAADVDRCRTVPEMGRPQAMHGGVLHPFRPLADG